MTLFDTKAQVKGLQKEGLAGLSEWTEHRVLLKGQKRVGKTSYLVKYLLCEHECLGLIPRTKPSKQNWVGRSLFVMSALGRQRQADHWAMLER